MLISELSLHSRHQAVVHWIVFSLDHLFLDLAFCLLFPAAQRILEKFLSAALFGGLLLKDVLQQILVPLHKPLRVNLPVSHLLLSVTLDALEQSLECVLLLLCQFLAFLGEVNLKFLLVRLGVKKLLFLDGLTSGLGLVVVTHCEVDLLLFAHLNDVRVNAILDQPGPR